MINLGTVLIVDDSRVSRAMMATMMAPYCDGSVTAGSGHEAIEILSNRNDIDLVLSDVVMKNGDGFELLAHIASMGSAAPKVVMVTAYPREKAAENALELGALAYLSKPTTVRSILNAVGHSKLNERREVNTRWRCSAKAYLLEGESDSRALFSWDVYNLSPNGAFIETKCPLPLGTEMDLVIVLEGMKAHVVARVVRVQEPSWIDVGGAGVEFVATSEEFGQLLEYALRNLEPEPSE